MKLKGNHTIKYTLAGKHKEVVAEVELKQIDRIGNSFQNIWYGVATLNDKEYEHPDLASCVNAQYMAEQIADDEIKRLRAQHGTKLRVKKKGVRPRRDTTRTVK